MHPDVAIPAATVPAAEAHAGQGTPHRTREERGAGDLQPAEDDGEREPEQAAAQGAREDGVSQDRAAGRQPGRLQAFDLEQGTVVSGHATRQPGEGSAGRFGERVCLLLVPRPGDVPPGLQHRRNVGCEDLVGPACGKVRRGGLLDGAFEQGEHQRGGCQLAQSGADGSGGGQPVVDLGRGQGEKLHRVFELERLRQLRVDPAMAGDRHAGGEAVLVQVCVDRRDAARPRLRRGFVQAVEEGHDAMARDPLRRILGAGVVAPRQLGLHPVGEAAVVFLPGGEMEQDRHGGGGIAARHLDEPAGELQQGDRLAAPRRPEEQQAPPLALKEFVDRLDRLRLVSFRGLLQSGAP